MIGRPLNMQLITWITHLNDKRFATCQLSRLNVTMRHKKENSMICDEYERREVSAMPRWHSVHAAHPETSAKTVSLRNGLSATIHSLKFTKTCHERNLTCTKKHVLQCFTMFYHDSTWKLYNTGWPDHAKDEGHTGRVPELRFLSSSGAAAVQQRCSSGAAVASKPLPGRASQLWGWHHPGQAAMVQCTGEQPRDQRLLPCFTMLFRPHHLGNRHEITCRAWMAYASWYLIIFVVLPHHFITWYYINIYIYTHNINIIFCQRYLSIHATRIFALKRIRLSDGMHIHFSAKRHFILQVLEVEDKNQSSKCRTWRNHAEVFFWEVWSTISVLREKCCTDCGPPTAPRKVMVQIKYTFSEEKFMDSSVKVLKFRQEGSLASAECPKTMRSEKS